MEVRTGMPGSDPLGEFSSLPRHQQHLLLLELKWAFGVSPSGHSLLVFLTLSHSCIAKVPKTATLLSQAEEDWSSILSYEKGLGLDWDLFGGFFGFSPPKYIFQQNSFPCWLGHSFSLNCRQNFFSSCWEGKFHARNLVAIPVLGILSECLCLAMCDPLRVLLQCSMTSAWLGKWSTVTTNTQDTQKQDFSFSSAVGSIPWDASLHSLIKPHDHTHRDGCCRLGMPQAMMPGSSADESWTCLGWPMPPFILLQVLQCCVWISNYI